MDEPLPKHPTFGDEVSSIHDWENTFKLSQLLSHHLPLGPITPPFFLKLKYVGSDHCAHWLSKAMFN